MLRSELATRREEFDAHFALARALEERMMFDDALGSINLSARHINTIKSGLMVHLYNIEEAIMSRALQFLGDALDASNPRRWTEHTLKEWLRESVVSRSAEGSEDARLSTVYEKSSSLLNQMIVGPQKFKKPPGTWDDKAIVKFTTRMNVVFEIPVAMRRRIALTPEYGDKTPLEFLAERRNAIAHGRRSFEDGAGDLDLSAIRRLADVTLDYLELAASAFQSHIENEAHLVPAS